MIECLAIAIISVLVLAVIPLDVTLKIILLVVCASAILAAYTVYQRNQKKLQDKINFLNYEILQLNEKVYDITGHSPMQDIEIKKVENEENDKE